jgi:predicted enzyme related to lactoylglutathione lyase
MMDRSFGIKNLVITIGVDNIDTAIQKIQDLGGKIDREKWKCQIWEYQHIFKTLRATF